MNEINTGWLFVGNEKLAMLDDGCYSLYEEIFEDMLRYAFPSCSLDKAAETAQKTDMKVYALILKEIKTETKNERNE